MIFIWSFQVFIYNYSKEFYFIYLVNYYLIKFYWQVSLFMFIFFLNLIKLAFVIFMESLLILNHLEIFVSSIFTFSYNLVKIVCEKKVYIISKHNRIS